MTQEPLFDISAPGTDTEALMADIRARVAEKMERGEYVDARIARAERMNLANLESDSDFLKFYLDCLKDAVFVDISDFDIVERRRHLGTILVKAKQIVWKLLKFYTYRLWSQQNQVNGLLLSAVESAETRFSERISRLETRLAALEGEPSAAQEAPPGEDPNPDD